MTRFHYNYIHCDECESPIYEGEFRRYYEGKRFCNLCWVEILKTELYENYIPRHFEELLDKAEEEMKF